VYAQPGSAATTPGTFSAPQPSATGDTGAAAGPTATDDGGTRPSSANELKLRAWEYMAAVAVLVILIAG